jgi:predicted Rdx family selenoprotein
VAKIVDDFEPDLSSILIKPYDDGRFIVRSDGKQLYDMDRTGKFPNYEKDIKPKLS